MKKLIERICDSIIRAAANVEANNEYTARSNAKVIWENAENEYCRIKPLGIYKSEIGTLEFDRNGMVCVSTAEGSQSTDSSLECSALTIGLRDGVVADYDAYADTISYLGYTFVHDKESDLLDIGSEFAA